MRPHPAATDHGHDLTTRTSRALDTWTLLSFVAARSSGAQLSANIVNLPLRPPAVMEGADRAPVGLVASSDGMTGLRAAVGLTRDTLLSHLAYEEGRVVEPLARPGPPRPLRR